VVTASWDNKARVWDATTGKPVIAPLEHPGLVNSAAFSPGGMRVATTSRKAAWVWDVATGRPVTAPLEHQGAVTAAAFSSDGTRVITASDDKTARVWDAATGKPVTPPLEHPERVTAAAFSPDGTRVVTTSGDNTVRVWTLSIELDSLEDWRVFARCSPFALVDGKLTGNPALLNPCPPH
jgi:WD40 repeat protein